MMVDDNFAENAALEAEMQEEAQDEDMARDIDENKRANGSHNERQYKNEEYAYKLSILKGEENYSDKFSKYFNSKFRSTQLFREDLEYYRGATDLLFHAGGVGSRLNKFTERFFHELVQNTDWQSSLDGFERQQQNTNRVAIDRRTSNLKVNSPPYQDKASNIIWPFKKRD